MPAGDKESEMISLAGRLLFDVEKQGSRYALHRSTDVSEPVRKSNLTLAEAEEFLNTWKLRGFHGG
jgi:hypothetical protein